MNLQGILVLIARFSKASLVSKSLDLLDFQFVHFPLPLLLLSLFFFPVSVCAPCSPCVFSFQLFIAFLFVFRILAGSITITSGFLTETQYMDLCLRLAYNQIGSCDSPTVHIAVQGE
jgi:hypothetical protein